MNTVTFMSPEERAIRERDASVRYVRDQRSKDVTFLLAQIDHMRADPLQAGAPALLAAAKNLHARLERSHDMWAELHALKAAIDSAEGR